jgi:hypothetical protein
LAFKPVNDLHPGAISLRVSFALSVSRASTWAVEEALSTHRYRADTACDTEIALIAGAAALGPNTSALGYSNEAGVHTGKDRRVRIHLGEELNPSPAG